MCHVKDIARAIQNAINAYKMENYGRVTEGMANIIAAQAAIAAIAALTPQWSAKVPTEPGDYYVSFAAGHRELAMIEENPFYGYPAGTLIAHTMREGAPSPLSELKGTAKWYRIAKATPPDSKGE